MKRPITPAYTFNPGAGTLNLSGIGSFDIRNLFAVVDLKTGALIYAPLAGYGYAALSGTTLTLAASMAGLSAADPLLILYDDGGRPAEEGVDGTGIAAPTGGSGIRGWLSGIYKALTGALTVTIGKAATTGDAAITAGGTAQMLFSSATPANGWKVANPDMAEDLWVSDSTTAAPNGQGSYRIPAGGIITTEPGEKPAGPVSVYGASTGHVITARAW